MPSLRLPLALAFLLVALLSLVQVNAYRGAEVTDRVTFTIDATGNAALALAAGSGNAVNQVSTTANGILQIDFRHGYAGNSYGFQTTRTSSTSGLTVPADIYQMRQVFTVTNNGGDCQDVTVHIAGGTAVNLTDIYGRGAGANPPGLLLWSSGSGTSGNRVKLSPPGGGSNQMVVDFWWQAATATASTGTFAIKVSATRSATCP